MLALQGSSIELKAPRRIDARAPRPNTLFSSWSDSGARIHTVEANESTTYTAEYEAPEVVSVTELPHAQPPPSEPVIVPPLTPLTAKVKKGPPRATRRAVARFVFSAGIDGARFRCKLDRRRFRPCRSPRIYRHLKPGKHVFRLYATYRGEKSGWRTYRWKVLPRHRRHERRHPSR